MTKLDNVQRTLRNVSMTSHREEFFHKQNIRNSFKVWKCFVLLDTRKTL